MYTPFVYTYRKKGIHLEEAAGRKEYLGWLGGLGSLEWTLHISFVYLSNVAKVVGGCLF